MKSDTRQRQQQPQRIGTAPSIPASAQPLPDPSKPLAGQPPLILLAICLFGEARGESDMVRRAVAQVILNRANNPRAVFGSCPGANFDDNLCNVILHPQQFSSLNLFDPNYPALLHPLATEQPEVWERCLLAAQKAIADRDKNDTLTDNSDHYFDDSILPPSWADPAKQTVKVGRLNFYRLYLPPLKRGFVAEPETSAPDPSSGSRLPAKASAAASTPALKLGSARDGLTPARESHDSRPHMSLPAPKSSRAHHRGPGPYPRYDRSRRLSTLLALRSFSVGGACLCVLGIAKQHHRSSARIETSPAHRTLSWQ